MVFIPLYFLQESVKSHKSNPSYNSKLSSIILDSMRYEILLGNFLQNGDNIYVTPRVKMTPEEITNMISYFEQQQIFCQSLDNGFMQCRFLEKY